MNIQELLRQVALGLLLSVLPRFLEAAEPITLRVLSYNIHHAEGTDGKLDLERIATIIRDAKPDLVALQEVDKCVARSQSIDQPAELLRLTGLRHVVFGKNIDFEGGEYGNAILSRFPIMTDENHLLPSIQHREQRGLEQRGVIRAEINMPGLSEPLVLMATHLDMRPDDRERIASAKVINELASRYPNTPALLVGDMNAVIGSPTLALLEKQWQCANAMPIPTVPAGEPTRQIDFILVRPAARWKVVETRVLREPVASDHLPIVVVLELCP